MRRCKNDMKKERELFVCNTQEYFGEVLSKFLNHDNYDFESHGVFREDVVERVRQYGRGKCGVWKPQGPHSEVITVLSKGQCPLSFGHCPFCMSSSVCLRCLVLPWCKLHTTTLIGNVCLKGDHSGIIGIQRLSLKRVLNAPVDHLS